MPRETSPYKPGIHSYNAARLANETTRTPTPIGKLKVLLLFVGIACLSYYAYTLADQKIYQVYGNWAFDQQIAGRAAVNFRDYIRERTPFGFFAGAADTSRPTQPPIQDSSHSIAEQRQCYRAGCYREVECLLSRSAGRGR